MALYKAHGIQLDYDGLGAAVVIPDVQNWKLPNETNFDQRVPVGNVSPTFAAILSQSQRATFETFALKTLLDNTGAQGACVKTTDPKTGVKAYLAKHDNCGQLVVGSVHKSYQIRNGLIYPGQITCEHGSNATCTASLDAIFDGTNAPVIIANNVALPVFTIPAASWTLGPATVGGVVLTDITRVTIDFGNEVTKRGTGSGINDTLIENRTHKPTITIELLNPDVIDAANIPIGGKVSAHATDKLYLRKRKQDATAFELDATAVHLKFTFAGIAAGTELVNAEVARPASTTLTVTLNVDSSGNVPLIINTASAIT